MSYRPTVIERAFELAVSGKFQSTQDVRASLRAEGYSLETFQGRTLMAQIRALLKEAERSKEAVSDTLIARKDD